MADAMTRNRPGRDRGQVIHTEVLAAARRLSRSGDRTFRLADVVRALPHRNERSVRTHVASRCCVNAPQHHAHRWPYFRRVRRGYYEIEPDFRQEALPAPYAQEDLPAVDRPGVDRPGVDRPGVDRPGVDRLGVNRVAEPAAVYEPATADERGSSTERSAIHAVIVKSGSWFVAECLEVAVVTQGRTLDETLANLREALELHLDQDEMARIGLLAAPRLVVTYETTAFAA